MAVTRIHDFTGGGETRSQRIEVRPDTGEGALVSSDRIRPQKFSELMRNFATDVNDLQFKAGHAIDMMVSGEAVDVHQVMVAVQQAGIALDLMLEIRNRTLEGYQELIRMQV